MLFKSTFAVAGFAAFSSAFLVPFAPVVGGTNAASTLPFDLATQADGRTIELACSGCAVPVGKTAAGLTLMPSGIESELQLTFEINHLNTADALTLNGVQLFPLDPQLNAEPLTATQVITTTTVHSESTPAQVQVGIGYECRINLVKPPTTEEQLALYDVQIQVIAVGSEWVDGLEAVEIKLIATPAGGLLIADLIKSSSTNPGLAPGAECTTMLCKFKSIVDSSFSQVNPAAGKLGKGNKCGSKRKGFFHHGQNGPEHGQDRFPYSKHGVHHHRRHSRIHRFLHAMKSIAVQVLIPVFIGIACGMAASFIGMIVGHAIVYLWRTFYRRGQTSTYRLVAALEEKSGHEDEASPAYIDAQFAFADEKSAQL